MAEVTALLYGLLGALVGPALVFLTYAGFDAWRIRPPARPLVELPQVWTYRTTILPPHRVETPRSLVRRAAYFGSPLARRARATIWPRLIWAWLTGRVWRLRERRAWEWRDVWLIDGGFTSRHRQRCRR